MPGNNPVLEMQAQRQQERARAVKKLEELAQQHVALQRPVFFVPGWTDEANVCWTSAYRKGDVPIKDTLARMAANADLAAYVTFTEQQSKQCKSFFDFGELLKQTIREAIGPKAPCDLVGHSMGGLDAIAAILDDAPPLLQVVNLVTVATPHQGSELGELGPILKTFPPHHAIQCLHLDPDQPAIRLINKVEARQTALSRVQKLYCLMGTRDMAVMRSARYNKAGLDPAFYKEKVEIVEIGGARHSDLFGITQDPRLLLSVIDILLGIELEKPQKNCGYVYKNV